MKTKGCLYIVSAPSGAGKSSLINALLQRFASVMPMKLSISHTTREMRPGEAQDISYHFVTEDEFKSLIERDAFYEYAKVFDNYYGTSREIVEQWLDEGYDVLLDIDWQGARIIREKTPSAKGIFILPPSLEELNRRLVARGRDNASEISSRMEKAQREISHFNEYDYVIVNDNFDESVMKLRAIITAGRLERERCALEIKDLTDKLLQTPDESLKAEA